MIDEGGARCRRGLAVRRRRFRCEVADPTARRAAVASPILYDSWRECDTLAAVSDALNLTLCRLHNNHNNLPALAESYTCMCWSTNVTVFFMRRLDLYFPASRQHLEVKDVIDGPRRMTTIFVFWRCTIMLPVICLNSPGYEFHDRTDQPWYHGSTVVQPSFI